MARTMKAVNGPTEGFERLTYDELEERCSACSGTGHDRTIQWKNWYQMVSKHVSDHYSLTRAIELFGDEPPSDVVDCGECQGAGSIPTALGASLLGFIHRHRKQVLADS